MSAARASPPATSRTSGWCCSTAYGDPLEAIDQRKVDRLRRLAARWLRGHDCHPEDVRIDMVGVLAAPGRQVEVEHVAGIG